MTYLMEITREVRNIRSNYDVPPARRVPLLLRTSNPSHDAAIEACREYLTSLARLSQISWGRDAARPSAAATAVVRGIELHLPLEGLIDLREERERLRKELSKVEQALDRVGRKLRNEEFLAKAPEAVVNQQKAIQMELQDAQAKLRESLGRIEAHLKS